ncbi:MAG: UDP-N-acetylmuramoyl-L-alanyl-D-glutamate--2,6-diaminopimelate ligase [Candidatus Paceibacterota bacterium]
MKRFKKIIKKLLPEKLFLKYHWVLAHLAAWYYDHPTEKMIVIGITGTKGKTSVGNFLWSVLNANGLKTGLTGTANIRIGDEELLNKYHMTMPGRFVLQKFFKQMLEAGCKYCIVETTSEGIKQYRHIGINYDWVIFTNLTPEHLASHNNNFEEYKEKKGELFATLKNHKKNIAGAEIKSLSIINNDDPHKDFFLNFPADKKITYGLETDAAFIATNISGNEEGVSFNIGEEDYELNIVGAFNIYNALPAIIVGKEAGLSSEQIKNGLAKLSLIPGRMEKISLGQDFTVIVDYAHEKESMTRAVETAEMISKNTNGKIIVNLGAEGGGRDKAKRALMGEIVGKRADYVVVSNVDPYDDDPTEIAEGIAKAALDVGKVRNENLFVIEDRRAGINKCLTLAHSGDVVIITGKGAEQSMVIGNQTIPWDDRKVAKEELRKILNP